MEVVKGSVQLNCIHIKECLRQFAFAPATQASEHIKPFHHYVGVRLVIEGGFHPDEITPHPPLQASQRKRGWILEFNSSVATRSELTVLGGMRSKTVDVVVDKKGVGPVVAVSVKGTCGAYRNLVNRMEEAIGDSTNLHVMYPGLVYGFLHLIRANREASNKTDVGVDKDGNVVPTIQRYYNSLCEMTGRRMVRNDYTRYESVGLVLVENDHLNLGDINPDWPPIDSPLRIDSFFDRLYEVYDIRFPLRTDQIRSLERLSWRNDSPLFSELSQVCNAPLDSILGYQPRIS